jgi:hypothetical protein
MSLLRCLNAFVLTGIALFFISVAGMVFGDAVLTEPGQPVNSSMKWYYLAAAAIMLANGAVSIWLARQHEEQKHKTSTDRQESEAAHGAEKSSAV